MRIVTSALDKSPYTHARNFITNASLRMKRMPEDIPVRDVTDSAREDGAHERTPREKGQQPT